MDDRYPKFLRFILRKFDFVGLPNLGMLIAALAVLGFIGKNMLGAPVDRFIFDPMLVRSGEWWRLFAYPIDGGDQPLWFLFYVFFIYFIIGGLESHWGPGPTTIFTILCYVFTVLGALAVNSSVKIWYYVLENAMLAYGTLFPNVEFLLFFIVPVKAKWFSFFIGGVLLFKFIVGGFEEKVFLLIMVTPYLLFFGKMLYQEIYYKIRVARNRKRFDNDSWR